MISCVGHIRFRFKSYHTIINNTTANSTSLKQKKKCTFFLNECLGVTLLLLFCTIFLSNILTKQFRLNEFCSFSSHSSHLISSHQIFVVLFFYDLHYLFSFFCQSLVLVRSTRIAMGGYVTESMATWTLSPAIDTLLCFITLFLFFVLFSLSVAIYSHVCVLFHQSIDSRASLSVTIIKHDLKRVLK